MKEICWSGSKRRSVFLRPLPASLAACRPVYRGRVNIFPLLQTTTQADRKADTPSPISWHSLSPNSCMSADLQSPLRLSFHTVTVYYQVWDTDSYLSAAHEGHLCLIQPTKQYLSRDIQSFFICLNAFILKISILYKYMFLTYLVLNLNKCKINEVEEKK